MLEIIELLQKIPIHRLKIPMEKRCWLPNFYRVNNKNLLSWQRTKLTVHSLQKTMFKLGGRLN